MVIRSKEELDKIELRRKKARERIMNKKPSLTHIEHIDFINNVKRRNLATQKTLSLSLDDNKNCKLKDFVEG
jgi:hypothetical protein